MTVQILCLSECLSGVLRLAECCTGLGIPHIDIILWSWSWIPRGIQWIFYSGLEIETCVNFSDMNLPYSVITSSGSLK